MDGLLLEVPTPSLQMASWRGLGVRKLSLHKIIINMWYIISFYTLDNVNPFTGHQFRIEVDCSFGITLYMSSPSYEIATFNLVENAV